MVQNNVLRQLAKYGLVPISLTISEIMGRLLIYDRGTSDPLDRTYGNFWTAREDRLATYIRSPICVEIRLAISIL